jgi:hypothetical protein
MYIYYKRRFVSAFGGTVSLDSEHHMKPISPHCAQNEEFLNFKAGANGR